MPQLDDAERMRVMENAARLLADAKLLADNNRFASAFALAILGVEEIGKIILDLWANEKVPPKPTASNTSHLRKQAAVGALLLASFAVKEFGPLIGGSVPDDDLIERVAKSLYESHEGRLFRHIQIGAVEKTKHLAMYRDEWLTGASLHADQFEKSDVIALFEYARGAVNMLSDERAMRAARAMYELRR